jgi:hypothetical protein
MIATFSPSSYGLRHFGEKQKFLKKKKNFKRKRNEHTQAPSAEGAALSLGQWSVGFRALRVT